MNDLEAFAKLVQALDPWRGQMIFIGGWGHRLHTRHPDALKQTFEPVFTRDTDLVFANRAPLEGNIKAALAAHGFNEEFSGTSKPPAAHYTLGNGENGFYAEFLTPLLEPPFNATVSQMRLRLWPESPPTRSRIWACCWKTHGS